MNVKKIIKDVKKAFWEAITPEADQYDRQHLFLGCLTDALLEVDSVLEVEEGIILMEENEALMEEINEDLIPYLHNEGFPVDDMWAISCLHLASDHRYSTPRIDYYLGKDSEGNYHYVIGGQGTPWMDGDLTLEEVFTEFLNDLGPPHPDRAMEAIKDALVTLNMESITIHDTKITPKGEYLVHDSYGEVFEVIDVKELKEISSKKQRDGYTTTFLDGKKQRILIKDVSFWQGSPDYTLRIAEGDAEDIALQQYLRQIYVDRIAVINPYPPHEVLKVVSANLDVCKPKGYTFDPETRKFVGPKEDHTCPPPEIY